MNNSAQAAAFHAPLLQPLNAIAGSFTSATAAASQGPLIDLLNGVQVQLMPSKSNCRMHSRAF
jgi:hypothetical protein